jgi:hypothetical protein
VTTPPIGRPIPRQSTIVALASVWLLVATAGAQAAQVQDPGRILETMVGEWSATVAAVSGPGQEPVRTESRVVVRQIGRWVVAESTGSAPNGQPVTAILTLGYDTVSERFVGTWISSMQRHLWQYAGTLDAGGATITLETEGPIMGDASRTTQYREIIEIEDADHHVIRSLILGPAGEWFEFARAEYRRIDPVGPPGGLSFGLTGPGPASAN